MFCSEGLRSFACGEFRAGLQAVAKKEYSQFGRKAVKDRFCGFGYVLLFDLESEVGYQGVLIAQFLG